MAGIHVSGQQKPVAQTQVKSQTTEQSTQRPAPKQPSLLEKKAETDQATLRALPMEDRSEATPMKGNRRKETEGAEDSQKSGKKHGKGSCKTNKPIPPGLAKKQAADLPAGNPWKAALEQREADQASAKENEAEQASEQTSAAAADASPSQVEAAAPSQAQEKSLLEKLIDTLLAKEPEEATKPKSATDLLLELLQKLLADSLEASATKEQPAKTETEEVAQAA